MPSGVACLEIYCFKPSPILLLPCYHFCYSSIPLPTLRNFYSNKKFDLAKPEQIISCSTFFCISTVKHHIGLQ